MQTPDNRHQNWQRSRHANIFSLNGTYYARFEHLGKPIRKSLKTKNYNAAISALKDIQLHLRIDPQIARTTFGGIMESYLAWLAKQKSDDEIGQSTVDYKMELIDAIRTTFKDFNITCLDDLSAKGSIDKSNTMSLADWASIHRAKYSATRTNGAMTVMRELLRLAVDKKCMSQEVADAALRGLKFKPVKYSKKRLELKLPKEDQLVALRNEVYLRCASQGSCGGWLFDFLLFSGARIDSANHVHWSDIDWAENKLTFRKAKYQQYDIPLFPQLRELLERIKRERPGKPDSLVLPVKSLHTALTNACKKMGLQHLSHHDLRHIFATKSIKSGVDIPTVAGWLGHSDGGRTCMMVYGHACTDHSKQMASKMQFIPTITEKPV